MVTDVTGKLHSKFGPATKSYFDAKKHVTMLHRQGHLNEKRILEYALAHKVEAVTVGLSLLCVLPVDVVERTLVHNNTEMILILAKALGYEWETAMALLFLGAENHRIGSADLEDLKREFGRLKSETSQGVLRAYQSRKKASALESEQRRLPQLHG